MTYVSHSTEYEVSSFEDFGDDPIKEIYLDLYTSDSQTSYGTLILSPTEAEDLIQALQNEVDALRERVQPTAEQIAEQVLGRHAIQPHWLRNGNQISGLLAEAVRTARGES